MDEVEARGQQFVGEGSQDLPQAPPEAVAHHRRTHRPADGEGHVHRLVADDVPDPQRAGRCSTRRAAQSGERRPTPHRLDQAARRCRPFRRRATSTARPPRVLILERNPCFFARFRVFGWYVRFIDPLLGLPVPLVGPPKGHELERGMVPGAPTSRVVTSRQVRERATDVGRNDPTEGRASGRRSPSGPLVAAGRPPRTLARNASYPQVRGTQIPARRRRRPRPVTVRAGVATDRDSTWTALDEPVENPRSPASSSPRHRPFPSCGRRC